MCCIYLFTNTTDTCTFEGAASYLNFLFFLKYFFPCHIIMDTPLGRLISCDVDLLVSHCLSISPMWYNTCTFLLFTNELLADSQFEAQTFVQCHKFDKAYVPNLECV